MFKISYDKKITMVQGDTGVIRMRIHNYELSQGDEVRFAIVNKANPSILLCQHSDKKIVLEKQVTAFEKDGSARIIIYPYDTEYLQPGKYLYEIQVKTKDGRIDTVVPLTSFTLMDGSIQGEFGQTTPSKPEPTPSEIELRFKRLENEIIPELGNRITNVENEIDSINSSLDNKAMLVNSTDWINLKEFGAKMDGVTDDSDVFQQAVNISNKNTVIFIGSGDLYLGKSIYLDNKGERIVLNIQGNNSNISGHQPQNSIQTKITCSEHFFSKIDGQVMPEVSLKMSGVLIQQKQENENFNVFNKLELKGSDISNISTINFGSVIKGSLTFTSRFHHNTCLGIMRSFLENENLDNESNLVDSQIHNNYLNGKPGYNAVCFNLGFTQSSLISDNFIDVFKYVYTSTHYNVQNVKARGNLYDLCYKLCEKNMYKCTFNHETFMRFTPLQVSHTKFTGVVDEEYGIFVKISLENVCVSDCIIGQDVANFYVYSNVNAITDRFIIFNNNRDYENPYRNLYDFTVYQENGRYVFSIDNNKPVHVTDLTITRPSVPFYNGQQVIYDNRVLRYYEYKFYNFDGSEFKQ